MVTITLPGGSEHQVQPRGRVGLTECEQGLDGQTQIIRQYTLDFQVGTVDVKTYETDRSNPALAPVLVDDKQDSINNYFHTRNPGQDPLEDRYPPTHREVGHRWQSGKIPEPKGKKHPVQEKPPFEIGTRVVVTDEHAAAGSSRSVKGTIIKVGPDISHVKLDHLESGRDGRRARVIRVLNPNIAHYGPIHWGLDADGYEQYHGVPAGTGVIVKEELFIENYIIAAGNVGRVLRERDDCYLIFFPQAAVEAFDPIMLAVVVRGETMPWCRWIDKDLVEWGWWNTGSFEIQKVYGSASVPETSKIVVGGFVRFKGGQPHKFVAPNDDGRATLNWAIQDGALLKVLVTSAERRGSVKCKIISGCSPEGLGTDIVLDKRNVVAVEEENIMIPGQEVEIVAEIVFKEHNLHGRKGRVILASDADKEIGIELDSNINAGSLDGQGKAGHCLYVSEGTLRKTE